MSNKTNIKEDIKILKTFKTRYKTINYNRISLEDVQAIENILAHIERLETENQIYKEEHQKITKALDFKPGTLNPGTDIAIEAIKKALIQATAKANAYDSLVEKIKSKKRHFEECDELIATSNDNYSDGTVIKRFIDTFQELLDIEK